MAATYSITQDGSTRTFAITQEGETRTFAITEGIGPAGPAGSVGGTLPWTSITSNPVTVATGKTISVSNTMTLAGTDASTLNIGTGGTLGSAAFTASGDYVTLAGTQTITGAKTFTGTVSLPVGQSIDSVYLNTGSAFDFSLTGNTVLGDNITVPAGATWFYDVGSAALHRSALNLTPGTDIVGFGGNGGTPSAITLTNASGTAANLTSGQATAALGLKSATTTVSVSSSSAPTSGQVLTATSTTAATWQTPSTGSTYTFSTGLTNTDGTVTVNASQTQITSVGTLTSLATSGNVGAGAATLSNVRVNISGTLSGAASVYGVYTGSMTLSPGAGNSAIFQYFGGTVNTAGNTIAASYGAYSSAVTKSGAGTITNHYGFYQEANTSATNNYGAYFADNVGIGIAAPTSKLHVNGTMTVSGAVTLTTALPLTSGGTGATSAAAAWTALGGSGTIASPTFSAMTTSGAATASTASSLTSGTVFTGGTTLTTLPKSLIQPAVNTYTGVTGVASTDVITATGHAFANGDAVGFTAITGGTGLSITTRYFVISVSGNTFQLSLTSGGAAINFTTDITAGTITNSGTWSTAGTMLGVNAASGFAGDLLNLEVGGSSVFNVNSAGDLTARDITLGTGRFLTLRSGAVLFSNAAGNVNVSCSRLNFTGGTTAPTASVPAFAISGTTITACLGDGTAGGSFVASGTLAVTGAATATGGLILGSFTVAAFPSTTYLMGVVTDALAPVVGAAVAAGGSAKCIVCYNGTSKIVTALL